MSRRRFLKASAVIGAGAVTGAFGSAAAVFAQQEAPRSATTKPIRILLAGYAPPNNGFSLSLKRIGDRVPDEVRQRRRRQVPLQHPRSRLQRRRPPVARGRRRADDGVPVEQLFHRADSRPRHRRPPVLVLGHRDRARRHGRPLRRDAGAADGNEGELPHPRLVRERLPAHFEPAATDSHAGGHEGDDASVCCRARCRNGRLRCSARRRV